LISCCANCAPKSACDNNIVSLSLHGETNVAQPPAKIRELQDGFVS
jgi:hypothetical protein